MLCEDTEMPRGEDKGTDWNEITEAKEKQRLPENH